ncbi:putative quinol monooxygenase [Acinetobacter sp. NIPH 2699]|uniref:putative quinol monooxygenase n=1 Tax=Acinetobacter sp. NIPH 2699 TaxID=2923433 RepID=UPI001F4AA8B0|nr:putative quinol monooxygenase [Acinetobacter sp. NIPH 2699]MCH7337001.1 antibiotic biosynthesis monooxygenase [Acinetobacter sp. NIPH 2699]
MTLKLIAEDFIQPDKIEIVLPLYQELVEKTKAEVGCIAYDLYHDIKQKGHFVFIEEWVDRAALDQHVQSEHFQRLVDQIDLYQVRAGRFTHLHGFETLLQE